MIAAKICMSFMLVTIVASASAINRQEPLTIKSPMLLVIID